MAPEIFQIVEVADPMRAKQLKISLTQLGEEGAIQVFRPRADVALLLGRSARCSSRWSRPG